MKHRNQLKILMALTTMVIIGLSSVIIKSAFAPTVPIGDATLLQSNGYDSNPTVTTTAVTGTLNGGFTGATTTPRDGDFATNINWRIGGSNTAGGRVNVTVSTFETSPPGGAFTIGWVDLKLNYRASATTDDRYRIYYHVLPEGANTWHILQDWVSGSSARFNNDGVAWSRAFSNVPEPNNGVWTWTDVGNIQIRVETQRTGAEDAITNRFYFHEAWATVYQGSYPAPNTISIQPGEVSAIGQFNWFYVDVFVTNVVQMHGFQFIIDYNTQALTAVEWFTYTPFILQSPSEINDTAGYVAIAFSSFLGDPNGFTGSGPVVRIYFLVDVDAMSKLAFRDSILSDVFGTRIDHTRIDGLYRGPEWVSAVGSGPIQIDPAAPIGTHWHEIFPQYSRLWTLTGWTDNGDNLLTPSDQIAMTNSTGWTYQYHVDVVTTTIHWTFKAPDVGIGAAESETPTETLPQNPIGTRWHQIYPVYSRTFTITSWIDNGNGFFDASDQFDWEYDDNPGVPVNAHLDAVSTDMIISQKPIPPTPPPVPEFPLGIGLVLALAPLAPIIYKLRMRPKKRVT